MEVQAGYELQLASQTQISEASMKKVFVLLVGAALIGCLASGEAWARGGGGGGHGGGGHGGGGHGGFGGGHGGFGYGGYGRGGFGYGGYGYGGFGLGYGIGYGLGYGGYGLGYGGYYGGYGYPYYDPYPYYGAPAYPAPAYGVPSYPVAYNTYYYASPNTAPSNSYANAQPTVPAATTAPIQMEIIVPDSQARVWVDGKLTSTMGVDRTFATAPVETGYSYTYNVRVSWNQAGQEMSMERAVQVLPGRLNKVDFTQNTNAVGTSTTAR
jgi:uncharacterized protein (TIGR03000 family)